MANMTTRQIKIKVSKLVEMLESLKSELEEIQSDTQEEIDNVEPYENKFELTQAQEERIEKLQEWSDTMEEALTDLENANDLLQEIE